MGTGLLDLPPDVLTEILDRLSLKTLYIAKSVCKTFLHNSSYSDDHYFAARHSAHASPVLILQDLGDHEDPPSRELYLLDPEHEIAMGCSSSNVNGFPPLRNMKNPIVQLPNNEYRLVNSCNGLIFVVSLMEWNSFVCNPITNEYVVIPLKRGGKISAGEYLYSMWLGCSVASNQYKILKFSHLFNRRRHNDDDIDVEIETSVLNIESNSWRVIENTPLQFVPRLTDRHMFLDGVIYWADYVSEECNITFFDFEREEFEVIKGPQNSLEDHRVKGTVVGVLDGCLGLVYCLSHNSRGRYSDNGIHSFVFWILRSNGDDKCWSKMFVIHNIYCTSRYKTVQVVKNGSILLHSSSGDILLYDPKDKSVIIKQHSNRKPRADISIVTVNPSFLSVKEILRLDKETLKFEHQRREGGFRSKEQYWTGKSWAMQFPSRVWNY